MLEFMSLSYSGMVIALAIAALAGVILWLDRAFSGRYLKAISAAVLCLSLPLFLGSGYHIFMTLRAAQLYPAPGQLVDVGGYKMHILAEGEKGDHPTVVWVSGGHDQGLVLHHLHKKMSQEARSILFDRPGSGWSEVGPFPRRVALEVQELHRLLKAAGEQGPYILVPWSFGGPLAMTYAQLYPQETAGLILMDTTFATLPVFDREANVKDMCDRNIKMAWRARFGLEWNPAARLTQDQLAYYRDLYAPIADVQDALNANNAQPAFNLATCSALYDSAVRVFGATQAAGALGDLPIYVIMADDYKDQMKRSAEQHYSTELEIKNAIWFGARLPLEMAALSSAAKIYVSPEGTTHSFPFEVPDYILAKVREMMQEHPSEK